MADENWHTIFLIELDFFSPSTLKFAQDLHRRCQEMVRHDDRPAQNPLDKAAQYVLAHDCVYPNQVEIEDNDCLRIRPNIVGMSGDIDQAVAFIQKLLAYENNPEWVGVEWSSVCEPIRVGGFGGGAVLFNKDEAKWHGTHKWLTKQLNKIAP